MNYAVFTLREPQTVDDTATSWEHSLCHAGITKNSSGYRIFSEINKKWADRPLDIFEMVQKYFQTGIRSLGSPKREVIFEGALSYGMTLKIAICIPLGLSGSGV